MPEMVIAVLVMAVCLIQKMDSAPMTVVDMTYVFDNTTMKPPDHLPFELQVVHNGTVNGLYWLQLENYKSGIHVGTHVDAPCHVIEGAICVDKLSVERMMAPAAVVDVTEQAQRDRDYLVTSEDLQKWEQETGDSFDGKIVLIRTGWGRYWGNKEAFTGTANDDPKDLHSPGMSPEACQWLVNHRRPYGLGVETLSLDYGPTKDNMAHQILLGAGLFGIECLANMDRIPRHGALLYVLPMKIGGASGAPVRVLATFPAYLDPIH